MLSGKDRRALRALGHHLKPIVQIGQGGITPGLLEAIEQGLVDHELIKVKVLEGAPLERDEAAEELAASCGAEIAQALGRTILLYKENPSDRKVPLPGKPLPPAPAEQPGERKTAKPSAPRAAKKPAPRKGTGAKLPPRRHR